MVASWEGHRGIGYSSQHGRDTSPIDADRAIHASTKAWLKIASLPQACRGATAELLPFVEVVFIGSATKRRVLTFLNLLFLTLCLLAYCAIARCEVDCHTIVIVTSSRPGLQVMADYVEAWYVYNLDCSTIS